MKCDFTYKGTLYPEEYLKPMKSYHENIVRAIKNSDIEFEKYREGSRYRMPVSERAEAIRVIGTIRKTYGEVLVIKKVEEPIKNKKNIITEILEVDITPVAERVYHEYQASIKVDKEKDSGQYNIGGDIMPTQDNRMYKGTNIDNQRVADEKASIMEERFADIGISSKIIYDTTLEASGALIGIATTEYETLVEKGIISNGQAAIVVNPNKLYSDTIFHEYGHLLVDLLGGTNDNRINSIYNSLINTPLADEVREKYPELIGEAYKRELITQALGKKANELYSNPQDQSSWKKFLLWVKNSLNKLFNIQNSNELVELANQLLGEGNINRESNLSQATQLQKEKDTKEEFKSKKIVERRLDTLSGIRTEIYRNLSKQINKLQKNKNPAVQEQVAALEEIQGNLNTLDDSEDEYAILEYVKNVADQVDRISGVLESLTTTSKKKMDLVGALNNQLKALSLVADIKQSLDEPYQLNLDSFGSKEAMQALKEEVDRTYSKLNSAKSILNGFAVLQLSDFMAPYLNYGQVEARDKYFKEFRQKPENIDRKKDKDYNEELEEYIKVNKEKDAAKIKKRNVDLIREKLRKSSADLTWFASRLQDEKDVNDLIIQLISKILDDSDINRDMTILNLKVDTKALYDNFIKNASGTDPKEIFKGYYEEGSDGNLYLTGEYSVEYHIQLTALRNKINKATQKYGKESKQVKDAVANLKAFYVKETFYVKESMDRKPKSKWKNPNYKTVKDTDMYQWLESQSKENDIKLQGNKSNIIASENYTVIKLPNMGKSGFEELTSGSLLQNIWENIQRTYKVRSDNTEYGNEITDKKKRSIEYFKEVKRRNEAGESLEELQDEINMLQILTDEVGDLKTQIPIFFRGQHSLKDISYDLASSLLLDSYMAENYHQKTNFKYAVELAMDLVNSRKVTQTEGFMKRVLVESFGGDESVYETAKEMSGADSNSAAMLASVIQNRLYGIKTIHAEYAQIANSLMAWSATTMLGFNFLAASSNLIQGKVVNFIESVGGQYYDKKDLLEGEVSFWADFQGWVDDMGRSVQTSKTSQLLDLLSVQGEFKAFTNKLTEDNRFKTLFKTSTLFSFNHMGEFYIHSTMMYAVLNRIKSKNAKGQYIDSKGKVVTKDKAMSIGDAISVNKETNKLQLNKHVKKTSFGEQNISLDTSKDKGFLEIKNLVNIIANDLHGQYNSEYQSLFQRYVLGKMVLMLRKWMIRGFTKRWRGAEKAFRDPKLMTENDKFYSEDSQSFKEGNYTSFLSFISRITKEVKNLGLSGAFNKAKVDMTEHQIANVKKTMAELTLFALTYLASMAVYLTLDGLDDDDEPALLYAAFYSRRLYNELTFFANPISTFQILRSPAATISYGESIIKLFTQMTEDGYGILNGDGPEYYDRGTSKGKSKSWKRTTDLFPVLSQIDRPIEKSAAFQFITY